MGGGGCGAERGCEESSAAPFALLRTRQEAEAREKAEILLAEMKSAFEKLREV